MKVLCGVVLLVTVLVSNVQGGPVGSLRIINGTEISIKAVPYQVYIPSSRCGGSILTKRHIVTAGHCAYFEGEYIIRAGSSNKDDGGQVVKVFQRFVHPNFHFRKGIPYYDFGLLVLAEDLVFNENVKQIALARDPAPDGTLLMTSGWGKTNDASIDERFLRAVELPQVNRADCQDMYDEKYVVVIDESMTCAGYEEGWKGACHADSGGPLVFNNTVYGVVSWGYDEPCAAPRSPTVFGNIPEVYDWYMNLIQISL